MRALATLAAADAILAEDTRVSRRLLDRYDISTPLVAYHEHNAAAGAAADARRASPKGEALALISDAGTPLISDPATSSWPRPLAAGIAVSTLPGPCAAIAALTTAALPTDRFFFEGFLPAKAAARRERIDGAHPRSRRRWSFYEAPSRLAESLADLAAELGPRPAAVARELTKLHEETRRATLAELAAALRGGRRAEGRDRRRRRPARRPPAAPRPSALDAMILDALAGLSVKDAAAAVAARPGCRAARSTRGRSSSRGSRE